MNAGVVATIIIAVYALYRGLRDFILNKDIQVASKKITLLDTVIGTKNTDIARDEQAVKEKSDVYENLKRSNNGDDH